MLWNKMPVAIVGIHSFKNGTLTMIFMEARVILDGKTQTQKTLKEKVPKTGKLLTFRNT